MTTTMKTTTTRIQQQHKDEGPGLESGEEEKLVLSIDEAFQTIGTGQFQWNILLVVGACFMADAMEIMLLSFLTLVLQSNWGLSHLETASIFSCMFAGAIFGSMILGRLGDRIGRRPAFLTSGVIIAFFGMLTAFVPGYVSLVFARSAVGFGLGGTTVPYNILAEFLPTESRGKYLLLINFFWTTGSILVPVIAYMTMTLYGDERNSWRLFVAICAIPCFLSVSFGMKCVPESPRWLLSKGKNSEAIEVLRKAAMVNGKDPNTIFPPGSRLKGEHGEESPPITELLKPKWIKTTLLLWIVWFGMSFNYYGTIVVVTRIFSEEDKSDETVDFDYSAICISSIAEVIGTILAIQLVERIGRVRAQTGSYFLGGLTMCVICMFVAKFSRGSLITLAFLARVFEMIGSCLTWVSTAELFSTEIRSTGHSTSNSIARISGFLTPYLVGTHSSFMVIGILMLAIHSITAFCASRLPETKGKVLDEVVSVPHDDNLELV